MINTPFITQERRLRIQRNGLDKIDDLQPGDRCYFFYREMVDKWKENPRWTTAHEIYKDLARTTNFIEDDCVARELAWQIFFQWWVVPYEREMEERNGSI